MPEVYDGQTVCIGVQAGDRHLYFFQEEDQALEFLEGDPALRDSSALNASRHVYRAYLAQVEKMQVIPPVPARLGPVRPPQRAAVPGD